MRPPKSGGMTFEKVKIGEFIFGNIKEVQYDKEHKFKGFEGKDDTVGLAVRFVFKLQGYEFPHFSRWMRLNLGEKANLYKKYVSKLVANARPDMDFDLDDLNGLEVKTVWDENGDFQNLENIWPIGGKLKVREFDKDELPEPPPPTEDDFVPEYESEDVPL
ncbi:MAG: hypothetical protein WC373_17730 [Smithella sp.]|jgi:hypothetical protein